MCNSFLIEVLTNQGLKINYPSYIHPFEIVMRSTKKEPNLLMLKKCFMV
jgi:hypothetical protein